MGQALYRKHRSKSLAEIVGQEHITTALKTAITSQRISHAYLFTGPRGVGKTSIARILAYEINKLPYDSEATHLDIIEIDAASNRRIDEVRDLRDKIHLAPASAEYKVYIIDEVHMLTREAFNALLKTLEEPPKHIVFILATTEVHKLPETIISRTQHYTFRPIEADKVVAHLESIAKQENITITKDALQLIAEHGGGSFRDSISILDQAQSVGKEITAHDIEQLLGIAPQKIITTILAQIEDYDAAGLINQLQETRQQGIAPTLLSKQLSAGIRSTILQKSSDQQLKLLSLLGKLIEVNQSSDPYTTLEISLLEYIFSNSTTSIPSKPSPTPSSPPAPKISEKPLPPKVETKKPPQNTAIVPENKVPMDTSSPIREASQVRKTSEISADIDIKASVAPPINSKPFDLTTWPDVVNHIKQKYNTLYGVLRMAQPEFADNTLTLHLAFAFHQKRLNDPKNRKIISDAIIQVSGATPQIACVITEKTTTPQTPNEANTENPEINTISNIFGGAELLES